MNKNLLIIIVCSLMTALSHSASHATQDEPTRWSSGKTMAIGATLGATEGIACSLIDEVVWWPVSWFLLSEIKALIVKAIINDAHRNGESLDASLLNNTSRLCSWLTYLTTVVPRIQRVAVSNGMIVIF
jgi:hypothetical protein